MGGRAEERWLVTISYRTEKGRHEQSFTLDELDRLSYIIENGPNFYAIDTI